MGDCIRYCNICGKEIPYNECINTSVLSKDISIDLHRQCFITIADIQKVFEVLNHD